MPRPGVGNPGNSGGKKGRSGNFSPFRKKVVDEVNFLSDAWLGKLDYQENERVIASGKYGGKHVWLKKMFEGNEIVINKLFERIHPPPLEVEKPYTIIQFNAYGDQTSTVGDGHVSRPALAAGRAPLTSPVQARSSAPTVGENKHVPYGAYPAGVKK